MESSPIYTSEPMATRALAAEIRHDPTRFLGLLRERSSTPMPSGPLRRVRCEAIERIDVLLEFDAPDGTPHLVGIEAKFDHELTQDQIARETDGLDQLFVLVADLGAVPRWLREQYEQVSVISWDEALACFTDSRITREDVGSIKIPKASIEARFNALSFPGALEGWRIETEHNGVGNPSIVFESPALPDGRTLRGQIQVSGRGMPENIEDVRFESHIGVAVAEVPENYFDPEGSDVVPPWIQSLRTLQREVLDGEEERLLISLRAPRASRRELGKWKLPLALKHLGEHAYLAKGYTDGWAIGPKTQKVPLQRLDELAAVTAEIFERWYELERS